MPDWTGGLAHAIAATGLAAAALAGATAAHDGNSPSAGASAIAQDNPKHVTTGAEPDDGALLLPGASSGQ
ncbi:hypothetical protein ACGF07_23210 [Kitasatospora sp. NPDC048194]|uniref:hypothetical protein n=1 Tax=Kitasatospora sp. NPDC048194 TaxID=3364045 RepID=UPI003712F8CA